jgi:hypothetical protein
VQPNKKANVDIRKGDTWISAEPIVQNMTTETGMQAEEIVIAALF